MANKFAYISDGTGDFIYSYSITQTGELVRVGSPALPAGLFLAAAGSTLFSVRSGPPESSGYLDVFNINDNGSLTPVVKDYTKGVTNRPQSLAAMTLPGTTNSVVFVGGDKGEIVTFRFVGSQIESIGPSNILNYKSGEMVAMNVDAESRYLYGAIEHPEVNPDGQLGGWGALGSFFLSSFGVLSYTDQIRIDDFSIKAFAVNPGGKFIYAVTVLTRDVFGFRVDQGKFSPIGVVAALPSGGTHAAMSMDGRYLYATARNALDGQWVGVIMAWSVNQNTGELTKIGEFPCGRETSALVIEPDGKYIYAPATLESKFYWYEISQTGELISKPSMSVSDTSQDMVCVAI
jgi:6-phosphogluconolactonase (cycloisomerase 2 family)